MTSRKQENLRDIEFLLISLADSAGAESRRQIINGLMSLIPMGRAPLFYIEGLSEPSLRHSIRHRFSSLLDQRKILHDLTNLMLSGAEGDILETGSFLLSRLSREVTMTLEEFRHRLDLLAEPVKERLATVPGSHHRERLGVLQTYLFREMGFRGNTRNYYDPKNSFLTHVLEEKRGIPVSLSVLTLLLARRLGLPMFGVNLPGHFIVKYMAPEGSLFMDPFNGGHLLEKEDCYIFLTRQGLKPLPAYLDNASSLSIIKRMYRNLINYYSAVGDLKMEKQLRQHFSVLEKTSIPSFD